jgi:hypothetical protein
MKLNEFKGKLSQMWHYLKTKYGPDSHVFNEKVVTASSIANLKMLHSERFVFFWEEYVRQA